MPGARVLVLLIVICAAAIRLHNITQPFVDNYTWRQSSVAMMAQNFRERSWNIFYPEVNWVGPGPGYQGREFQTVSYLAALLYGPFGQQEWVGRSISVVAGLLGIVAVYGLTRRVWDEPRAIVAAAMMAVAAEGVRIERSFLPDATMVALVTASAWMFVTYLQTDRRRHLVLALAAGTLGNLTKIPGMIVGLPLAYAALTTCRISDADDRRRLMHVGVAAALSAAPVAAYYLWARHLSVTYPPFHFAGQGNWIWDMGLSRWIDERFFAYDLLERVKWMWTTPAIMLAAIGFVRPIIIRGHTAAAPGRLRWFFQWWIVGGGVYVAIGARELAKNPSNLHILTPAVAALAASAIVWIASGAAAVVRSRTVYVTVVLALLTVVTIAGRIHQRLHETYDRAYHLGLALREASREGDVVVALGETIGDPAAIYYSGRRGWLFPPYGQVRDWVDLPPDETAIRLLEQLRSEGATLFGAVAVRRDEIRSDRPRFAKHLERTAELVRDDEIGVIYRLGTPRVR